MKFKTVKFENGKKGEGFVEVSENEVSSENIGFDFAVLNDGKIARKIMFVDADGNQIKLTV